MDFAQEPYEIRCEWGAHGLRALLPGVDAIVIVDVLSFSTAVDIAVGNGAIVYPYAAYDETTVRFAQERGALLARRGREAGSGPSLSPASLVTLAAGTRLVLPSPNGATLSGLTGATPTFAGCLRNARAVAAAAQRIGPRIGVVAAGERWPDGSLRPGIEDWLGAGAIIHHLLGTRSPEAEVAAATFGQCAPDLAEHLQRCGSGQELIGRGFAVDVALAAELNRSVAAPMLVDGAYVSGGGI